MISNGSSNCMSGRILRPVTFLMLYLYLMRSVSFSLALTSSRNWQIRLMNSGCVASKEARLTGSLVSNIVPSAKTMRAESMTLSLLACVPQFMPDALFMTIPPTIALLTDAGSGANLRPKGANMSFTLWPIIPGCNVICLWSLLMEYFSQFFPATIKIELLMD